MHVHEKNEDEDEGNIHEKIMIEAVKLVYLPRNMYIGCLWCLDRKQKWKTVNDCGKYKTASVCLLPHCCYGPGVLKYNYGSKMPQK